MIRALLSALLLVVFGSCAAPAAAQNNSLANVLDYAENTGRVVLSGQGDSTFARTGAGHFQGAADAMMTSYWAAGIMVPPNWFTTNNETGGFAFARRRLNASITIGVSTPLDVGDIGYPTTLKQYGISVPLIGRERDTSTTTVGAIGTGAVNITLTDATAVDDPNGQIAYILVTDGTATEIIQYTDIIGNVVQSSGMVRAVTGTATAFAGGSTVRPVFHYEGPQPVVLQGTTLTAAIPDAVSTADIQVASTAGFPRTGRFRMAAGEIISYTGLTATTFTGITRNVFGLGASSHSNGSQVSATSSNSIASMMRPEHPLGVNTAFVAAMWFKHINAVSFTQGRSKVEAYTQTTPVNTDNTFTTLGQGSNTNPSGSALGTIGRSTVTIAQPATDRQGVTLNWGDDRFNLPLSSVGPSATMWTGIFGETRPRGFVQAMGISAGGKTLNSLHLNLNRHDTATGVNEFSLGMIERYKVFRQVRDAAVGGNNAVALMHLSVYGHNETGGQGYTGPVNLAYPWTYNSAVNSLVGGNYGPTDTTIVVENSSGMLPSNGMILVDTPLGDEYIAYRTQTSLGGNQWQLNDCIRGAFGSVPQTLGIGDAVYQGYKQVNPKGFAADVLFDYLFHQAAWVSAGGSTTTFFYVYCPPIPVSASPSTLDPDTIAGGTNATREGRLREYVTEIRSRLGSLPGFIIADPRDVMTGSEGEDFDAGENSSSVIHHTNSAYRVVWHRMMSHYTGGDGNPTLRRGGLRGRDR